MMLLTSDYKPPFLLRNGHLQSIYPSLFRKFDPALYKRERISTPDDDFLDLDWSEVNSDCLAVISHGMEGSSHRAYVIGMARALNHQGWDALAWNFRSCGGEMNRQLRMYHSGSTDDLDLVINHALLKNKYKKIALIGFSMGGNLTLVHLGQKGKNRDQRIRAAVVFSVPTDLHSSSMRLGEPQNILYMKRFLRMLHRKVRDKKLLFPDKIDDRDFHRIKNFKDFDDRYTAPIHGFKNAEDYWHKCSSKLFLKDIAVPTLIVNAKNDPFLPPSCYPVEDVRDHPYIYLEIPKSGGHVGFVSFNSDNSYWSEKRTIGFLSTHVT
ncbi:MAG: YheT family hydrolase [Calditrichaceae bacterium]